MIKEIREAIEKKKAIIGTTLTLKNLRFANLNKVFVAKNCPEKVLNEIKNILGNAELVHMEQNNDEFGVLCKRQHSISVLGLTKND